MNSHRRGACGIVNEPSSPLVASGAPPIELEMRCAGGRTIVGVTDSGEPPILPRAQLAADAPSGRGLRLLEALATDWGVDTHPTGKTFWFAL